jgi:proteasome assembly chaperone 3
VNIVFANQLFILITQVNKVGSILKAWSEPKIDGGRRYLVENILGRRDDPLLMLYARQLIERSPRPLLLAISLREEGRSKEHFQAVINKIVEMLQGLQ